MSLVVYNTLTRKKQPFEPVSEGKVGMYLCGPTVYKPSHIGHAVGPVIFDAIKRFLVHKGYEVTWVVNVTDVDDKLIVEAEKQGTTTFELAERILADYLKAMKSLRVEGIDIMPKASEHMQEIIDIIQKLESRDIAYESGGDVYFDVKKDDDYGKLSNRDVEQQEGQRDLKSGEKRNPGDFALWKNAKDDEPDEVKFDSPWGKGRPGWHIECSAMASRYLGDTFDIHGGGVDLIFPHHENEIAQSESASGKTFASVWMHHGLTKVNTKKISKSDQDPEMVAALNKMTLHNLLAAYDPEHIRFFILSTHYRSPIEYSDAELASKKKGIDTFYRLFDRVERACGGSPYSDANLEAHIADEGLRGAMDEQFARFEASMLDDFNTANAMAAMYEMANQINRFIQSNDLETEPRASARAGSSEGGPHTAALTAARRLIATSRLLGLFIEPKAKDAGGDETTETVMRILIDVRALARSNKQFDIADLIRDRLTEAGITLEDRKGETIWRKE